MVDVSYGGEIGFNQAIELSAEALGVCEAGSREAFTTKVFRRRFRRILANIVLWLLTRYVH